MSTTEQTALLIDDKEVDPFVCHLYLAGQKISFCGVRDVDDPHCLMHHDYKHKSPGFNFSEGPGPACPACGAPICEACRRLSREHG